MADLLGIGVSGLVAFQQALNTTGHNISNANTAGYSRQVADLSARQPQATGAGFIGQGVDVTDITRMYNQFLTDNVQLHSSASKRLDTYQQLSSQIDNLLADPKAGLTPALSDFFASVQGVNNNPSSIPARQTLITSAESLVSRFHYLDQRLQDLTARSNTQLSSTVDEINTLASGIADLNKQIVSAQGAAGGHPANDLLDKRDALIQKLSEQVSVKTLTQKDGSMNVFIGSGQGLVVGNSANTLSIGSDQYNPDRKHILIGGSVDVTAQMTGGVIGGVLDFQNNMLDPSLRSLGRVAAGLAKSFNDQHKLGIDLTNTLGQDFFKAPQPVALAATGNVGAGKPALAVVDASKLTTDDYRLEYSGGNWQLTNLTSNQTVPMTGAGTTANPFIADGISIDMTGIPTTDKFMIRPTASGAQDIGMNITDPSRVAVAGALSGSEPVDANGYPTNTGTGGISAVAPAGTGVLPLGGNITMTYDATNKQFAVTVGGGRTLTAPASGTLAYDPTTDGGKTQTITVDGVDINFQLSGAPANGDSFTIADNQNATTDNRNGLALSDLETKKILGGNTSSFNSGYGQIVSDVGAKTHQAQVNSDAETTLYNQAVAARDAVSGVNLDEEAANLVRYQQAYQAAAKAINIASSTFQTLLQAVGA